jgi:hypothetical protein
MFIGIAIYGTYSSHLVILIVVETFFIAAMLITERLVLP